MGKGSNRRPEDRDAVARNWPFPDKASPPAPDPRCPSCGGALVPIDRQTLGCPPCAAIYDPSDPRLRPLTG